MKNILVILLCSLAVISCNDKAVTSSLSEAEVNMQDNPELSIEILKSIDRTALRTRKQRARHALLYSIALDKNYIDIANDSIIAPAVKYFAHHGDINTRFACYYYEARIHENAGNLEDALLCVSRAEKLDTSRVDDGILCMLYAMKGSIYDRSWRTSDAVKAKESARVYALSSGKYRHYAYYTLSCAISYRKLEDESNLIRCIEEAKRFKEHFGLHEVHLYNDVIINYMLDTHVESDEILRYVENYIEEYPQIKLINWRNIARVYHNAGQVAQALLMLERHAAYNDISKDPGYYAVLSELCEMNGNHVGALQASNLYSEINDAIDMELHKSDIRLIEERYLHQIDSMQQRHRLSYTVALLIFLCSIFSYYVLRWRKKHIAVKKDLEELQDEYDLLKSLQEKLIEQNREASDRLSEYSNVHDYLCEQECRVGDTEKELLQILGHRLKSLSAFLQRPIPDSLSKVAVQIDHLKKNRNYIVDSIGFLYAVNYPVLISELRSFGLTSSEIGYCCLLLIGLNIPEAGVVIGREASIYNISSAIRKKMALPTCSSNLDKWLAKRFTELYPEQ